MITRRFYCESHGITLEISRDSVGYETRKIIDKYGQSGMCTLSRGKSENYLMDIVNHVVPVPKYTKATNNGVQTIEEIITLQ